MDELFEELAAIEARYREGLLSGLDVASQIVEAINSVPKHVLD